MEQKCTNEESISNSIKKLFLNCEGIIDNINKGRYAQFHTPWNIACYMSKMFNQSKCSTIRILDPGSGFGILTAAFINNILLVNENKIKKIIITMYEIDEKVIPKLNYNMNIITHICNKKGIQIKYVIHNKNFISTFSSLEKNNNYNYVIVNPPYKKLKTKSEEKQILKKLGLDSTNYYSAFVSLAKRLLIKNGELVAITPRSFCNGEYFNGFRKDLLYDMSFDKIHLFESRNEVFKNDEVLQESIIYHCIKNKSNGKKNVQISYSYDESFNNIIRKQCKIEDVILPNDDKFIIRILKHNEEDEISKKINLLDLTLDQLGISVSTGPVVDFRELDKSLLKNYERGTIPIIFSEHIGFNYIEWPKLNVKKYNYIMPNNTNKNKLRNKGVYLLIKRITSKEDKRRIVSAICNVSGYKYITFDNKVNYYHINKSGISYNIAKGLNIYLSSTIVDIYFRTLSGNTQVNASDLKSLKYPSETQILELAKHYSYVKGSQRRIDNLVNRILFTNINDKEIVSSAI
ncbi:Eco57I restriction-modification methylase domain-containing protein [Clostridium botulinum]|uniref:site-specific DNA-methyltransferase (adenine-specific) n=1 Tax=Clostridium botulinum TaxID=1491 RepID=A0A6B4JKB1_CLOBO|nr:Eco57I restriction-modification methylase domain-containing protein [Clostridium botulinum]EES49624.1 N(4)/N(6)-methyltransferase family protein [Clostridium botulinum E1 str. 'BoNT E Beluga']MBY6760145.1 Eco57I restriction-modification methylase domain-containing protein [Clostridium botulinum]MBY6919054.1 Eco57I restriction-modification methylase domain-containing protein [Clostridium botulinum]MCR1132223.1 Eco57I restriction-modification methylase domain-containing protein [Clostridium bo